MDIELQNIVAGYNNLLASVERGEIEVNVALHALNNMVAIDSTGAEWCLDPSGTWLRGFPGEAKVPANPEYFMSTAGRAQSPNYFTNPTPGSDTTTINPNPSNYDFQNNIDAFNSPAGSKSQSSPNQSKSPESTLNFAKKLVGSRVKNINNPLRGANSRKYIVISVCLVVIIFAFISSKNNTKTEVVNPPAVNSSPTQNPEPIKNDVRIEELFNSELKSLELSSFSYTRNLNTAKLFGLAKLDPDYNLIGLESSATSAKFKLVFQLDKTVESMDIKLVKIKGKWQVKI